MLFRSGERKSPYEEQKEVLALKAQVVDLKKKKDSNNQAKFNWKICSQATSVPPRHTRIVSTTGALSTQCGPFTKQNCANCLSPRKTDRRETESATVTTTYGSWLTHSRIFNPMKVALLNDYLAWLTGMISLIMTMDWVQEI